MVLLDSGAAVSVVMSCLTPHFTSEYPSLTWAASTADGNSLSGLGELETFCNVLISDTIQHTNCISISQLSDLGINVTFSFSGAALANCVTSCGVYSCPCRIICLCQLEQVLIVGSQNPDIDDLDLWHRRQADTSHRVILEAARNRWCSIEIFQRLE